MEFTQQPTSSTPELTSELAMQVYNKIKEAGNADLAYKAQVDSALEPEWFVIVDKEGDRIINEINQRMSGSYMIEPAYPATYTEDGEIDEEEVSAVYYSPTTKTNLLEQLSSELLNVETVLNDVMAGKTWTDFKASYSTNE